MTQKKIVLSHRIYCQNFIQIDNVQQCHFQIFELFWAVLSPKNFPKNLKLRIEHFLVKVTASLIWAGMPHIYIYLHAYQVTEKNKNF